MRLSKDKVRGVLNQIIVVSDEESIADLYDEYGYTQTPVNEESLLLIANEEGTDFLQDLRELYDSSEYEGRITPLESANLLDFEGDVETGSKWGNFWNKVQTGIQQTGITWEDVGGFKNLFKKDPTNTGVAPPPTQPVPSKKFLGMTPLQLGFTIIGGLVLIFVAFRIFKK